jgi:hypothetical protein
MEPRPIEATVPSGADFASFTQQSWATGPHTGGPISRGQALGALRKQEDPSRPTTARRMEMSFRNPAETDANKVDQVLSLTT